MPENNERIDEQVIERVGEQVEEGVGEQVEECVDDSQDLHHIESDDLWEVWNSLSLDERVERFDQLDHVDAEDFFSSIPCEDQVDLLIRFSEKQQRHYIRGLAPDDAADVFQLMEDEELVTKFKGFLPESVRKEVAALMAYEEDDAGGLMSPRFARIRPDMKVDEAISYVRKQIRDELETMYYIYVLDSQQHLLGVVSFEDLFKSRGDVLITDLMETDITTVDEEMDQEKVAILFAREDFFALPVVNSENVMVGIITIDDIVDVVTEEATEDIQKMGGMAALDSDYTQASLREMYIKRVGWLVILFLGTIVSTRAMAAYEDQMAKVIVLCTFVPLITASGGNTGSQAATMVTRAMALGELRLRDAFKVCRRELIVGSELGATLGALGFCVVAVYQLMGLLETNNAGFWPLAATISISVFVLVLAGSLLGSMLPFLLKLCRVDPASASAPFVTTIIDATGIIIYFTTASIILSSAFA